MSQVVRAVARENILGEGPVWDARSGRLWWLDIKGLRLEWLSPGGGADGTYPLEVRASAVAPRRDGTLVMANEKGIAVFDPASGRMTQRLEVEPDQPWNRSNDGSVDTGGRFWFSTMDDTQARRSGAVYRLDPDWSLTVAVQGMGIPNTTCCSPDGRTFYLADSRDDVLWAYDLNPETGALGDRRAFADTRGLGGSPDGSAVDAEGYLWNAQWGLWRVVRYAPDGSIDRIVELPVEQPSKCAFGGEDLSTLYVASAREGLLAGALEAQPWAGSLLALDPGVKGWAPPPFGG
jgi:L-arabinonolactonase